MPIEVVVENFRKALKEASSDEDIRHASRTEEALVELDAKLGDFAETRIEMDNYRQKVKDSEVEHVKQNKFLILCSC